METVTSENIIRLLNWRYATKSFDTSKKLNDVQLATLLNAVQLAPSSYGLQPYQIIVISNQEVKETLKFSLINHLTVE